MRSSLLISAITLLSGCTSPTLTAIATQHAPYGWEPSDPVVAATNEALADAIVARGGEYPERDRQITQVHRIPAQPNFPDGATMIRAVAPQAGVAEAGRWDVLVAIYCLPGRPPAVITGGAPSKGSWGERYYLYDIGDGRGVLLIAQADGSAVGGGIALSFWDTESNTIKPIWEVGGEEDGRRFTHSLQTTRAGLGLTIFGIFAEKRVAYETIRTELEEELGFSVEFAYGRRHL